MIFFADAAPADVYLYTELLLLNDIFLDTTGTFVESNSANKENVWKRNKGRLLGDGGFPSEGFKNIFDSGEKEFITESIQGGVSSTEGLW